MSELPFEMKNTRVVPHDHELAARQWAEWRASRRHLLKMGAFGGGAAALAAAGLAAPVSPFLRSAAAQDAPKTGGSISMSLADSDASSFDPPVPPDNMAIWTMLLFYDQLVRVAPDGLSIEPGLATEWSASEDGLHYTFKLRDAQFHDGTPVTSADVKYCLERAAKGETAWQFILSVIDTVDTPDEKTAVINLSSVWAPFEADLAIFAASIFPKAAHEAQGDALFDKPIGSGPFMFDSWDRDVQIVLKKNPNYWEPGKPYLDELTFKVLSDSNARMLQFQGGELDIVTSVPPNQIEAIKSNPDYVLIENSVARIDYIGLNVTREPFTDKALRQAINYAVNKQAIIDNVMFGAAEPATSFLPKMPGRDASLTGYPYDVAKAKELAADWVNKGWSATLIIGAGDAVGAQVAQLVVTDLQQIGGNVSIEQVEGGAFNDRVFGNQDFDLYLGYFTTDIIDPDELASFAVLSDGGVMAVGTGYKNDQVDQLLKDAQKELDKDKRQQMYNEVQKIHLDDAPFLFLFYPTGRTAVRSYVKNFNILPTGNYRLWEVWRDDV